MKAYATEMKEEFLGPMSVTDFVDHYFPNAGEIPWDEKKSALDELLKADTVKSEENLYSILVESLGAFCDGSMELVDTSKNIDTVNAGAEQDEVKPDITMYKVDSGRVRITDMSLAQTHVEVKFDPQDDPFTDVRSEDTPFVHTSQRAEGTRGQIITYAIAQLSRQYRTHLFTVFVQKEWARLIRWDRSGAVVTQKFNISTVEGAKLLAEFVWRFTRASDATRGLDETVTRPGEEDAEQVARARQELGLAPTAPMWKFAVYDDKKKGEVMYCYGSNPRFRGRSALIGRCTRCTLVWDPMRERCVLLKDTWRVVGENMMKEGDVYDRLQNAKVQHIAKFYQAGDIPLPHHHTETTDVDLPAGLRSLRQHQHYRMLLEDVGEDITHFDHTRNLASAVKDAMKAHQEAYYEAGILHRDISAGNILVGKDGQGYLIDWDLSKPVEDLGAGARQPVRTGTWQFIAARLLLAPVPGSKPVFPELEDDLESFFHVLSWTILRFTIHGVQDPILKNILVRVYDDTWDNPYAPGGVDGGTNKRDHIVSKYMAKCAGLPPTALRDLVCDLETVFTIRYEDKAFSQVLNDKWNMDYEVASDDIRQEMEAADDRGILRRERLNSVWMIKRFQEAIDSDNWPEEQCVRHEHNITLSKRKGVFNGSESQAKRSRH